MCRARPSSSRHPCSQNKGDAVDLHVERTEPARRADEDACRLVRCEILGVDLVYLGEVAAVGAVDVALHDAIERRSGRLEAALEMFHHSPRLLLDRQDVVAAVSGFTGARPET